MSQARVTVRPDGDGEDTIVITEELAAAYGLDRWAAGFSLMTAGYRDRLDPDDLHSAAVGFNSLTAAILVEAKARVFEGQARAGEAPTVHIGGETRPHTQEFIRLAARIYAAHGFRVRLRAGIDTTPIWYSSFGVAYDELGSGDNYTASHSQFFKGGWKPMDAEGKQLVAEEAAIVAAVKAIVRGRQTIPLAPWPSNPDIVRDFDIDEPYVAYLRNILGEGSLRTLREAGEAGFRALVCTVGGSMRATSERLFARLGITTGEGGLVGFRFGEEDSEYHRLGHQEDGVFGVDPGTARIYRNVGAQDALLSGAASFFLIWDPDGDRLKVCTVAPLAEAEEAERLGLEVDERRSDTRCVVYLTPNQLYLVLAASRLEAMEEAGSRKDHDWFIGASYPTTRSLDELARAYGLACPRVKVGFKWIGTLCAHVESQLGTGQEASFTTAAGVEVPLGRNPRALILCEESGGANVGGEELLRSRSGRHAFLALREKDGMQLGTLALALAAGLHRDERSFVRYYADLAARYEIGYLHYERTDVVLYDESKMGDELLAEKARGAARRDRTMAYFKDLVRRHTRDGAPLAELEGELRARRASPDTPVPPLTGAFEAGEAPLDGPVLEFDGAWAMLRASGTDALLRYYVEGRSREQKDALTELLVHLRLD